MVIHRLETLRDLLLEALDVGPRVETAVLVLKSVVELPFRNFVLRLEPDAELHVQPDLRLWLKMRSSSSFSRLSERNLHVLADARTL